MISFVVSNQNSKATKKKKKTQPRTAEADDWQTTDTIKRFSKQRLIGFLKVIFNSDRPMISNYKNKEQTRKERDRK